MPSMPSEKTLKVLTTILVLSSLTGGAFMAGRLSKSSTNSEFGINELRSWYGDNNENLFISAIKSENLEHVNYLVNYNPGRDEMYKSISLSTKEGYAEIFKTLSEYDKSDKSMGEAILNASEYGHSEIVQFIIDNELVDVNRWMRSNNDASALHLAALNNHSEVVKLLISAGADVNKRDKLGDTPLHDAVVRGHLDVVKLLTTAGSDRNIPNKRGDTPLDLANSLEDQYPNILDTLIIPN